MPLSQLIGDILNSNLPASDLFRKEGFSKHYTQQHINELIQEADGGNQWAQYYVGM